MRRLTVLAPIVALVGVLLARRELRRRRALRAPLAPPPHSQAPIALLEAPSQFVSIPWELVDAPRDRAELTLRYTCGEQLELDRADAQETPTQVFVTLLMRWRPSNGDRSAGQRRGETVVAISGPLGERELVHAPVDLPARGDDPDGPPLYP